MDNIPLLILSLAVILSNCGTTFACNRNWMPHGSSCFMFSHTEVTWGEATSICQAMGAYLAEPFTQSVDAFLVNQSIAHGHIYWLGGSDLVTESEWQWTSSQLMFDYTNWIPADPNNANAGEDCLINNWSGDGKWADYDCEMKEYFICQMENDGVQPVVIGK